MIIKVLQWNIGGSKVKGDSEDIRFFSQHGLSVIKEALVKINPDIACFQELHFSNKEDQLKIYSDSLGHKYTSSIALEQVSHLDVDSAWGLGISSKYPILNSHISLFKNPNFTISPKKGVTYNSFNYGVIYADILINKNVYTVCCLHSLTFRLFKVELNSAKAKDVFDSVSRPLHKDFDVLCGDFNVPTGDPEKYIPLLLKYKKAETKDSSSISGAANDLVFYSPDHKLISSEVFTKDVETDHFPIVTKFKLQ